MKLDEITNQIYIVAYNEAKLQGHAFMTSEHVLAAILFFDAGKRLIRLSGGNIEGIQKDLQAFFDQLTVSLTSSEPEESPEFTLLFEAAGINAAVEERDLVEVGDLIQAFYTQGQSAAVSILGKNGVSKTLLTGEPEPVGENEPLPESFKEIASFVTDMTEKAANQSYDPLIGRTDIMMRTEQVLLRRKKNNPIHVGEPGVGKTALVEGLALRIATGQAPQTLMKCRIFSLDIALIIAGTKYRGEFEERFKLILDTLSSFGNAIIYIDEIHTVVGAGAVNLGAIDAAGIIKPYLTEGGLRFIGSTTYEEYKKYFSKDKALLRRFQKIEISEPSIEETITILKGLKKNYEKFHQVVLTESALEVAARLSAKYIHDRRLPDKAVDVVDEAAALCRMRWTDEQGIPVVCNEHMEEVVATMAKVPKNTVSANEALLLRDLPEKLKMEIFGQDKAIDALVEAVKRSRAGLEEEAKPVACLLFVGPTGVGKTELARLLAKFMGIPLLRYDMSEYQQKHDLAKLIGSPPGYVGYEEGGLLTEAVRKSPYSVLLLDEVEKAHPDVLNILLQIMDYGTLTDNSGLTADFKNTIIIMTSNAGAAEADRPLIGFEQAQINTAAMNKAVDTFFSPEFRNRLDRIVVFEPLNEQMAVKIAEKALSSLSAKLLKKNIIMHAQPSVSGFLARLGQNTKYGAREILRTVDMQIKPFFVDESLFKSIEPGYVKHAYIRLEEGKFKVTFRKRKSSKAKAPTVSTAESPKK